jgi:branched-chain amino acid transport system ATP-binding protein
MFFKSTNINASYGKKEVLHGVSIDVYEGEIVSVIGPNGAGKSTFLKVVFGLLKPVRGDVIFLGQNITRNSPRQNNALGISYFIQGGEVFTNLTVEENLELGCSIFSKNGPIEERKHEVFQLFSALKKYKNKRAGLLSGGEKQMLSMGIILIRKPKFLLLDEPSAGLAPVLAKQMTERIKEIRNAMGISVLMVEQNIPQALSISDRIYLLRNGRVAGCDIPENIIKEKRIGKIFFS